MPAIGFTPSDSNLALLSRDISTVQSMHHALHFPNALSRKTTGMRNNNHAHALTHARHICWPGVRGGFRFHTPLPHDFMHSLY